VSASARPDPSTASAAQVSDALREAVLGLVGNEAGRRELWQWQFERNPRGVPYEPLVERDDQGRVVGFNGEMPVRIRFDGEEFLATWSCDFHVHESTRGTGVGRRLKERLHERHPFLMTLGVSPIATRVLTHLGWRPYDGVRNFRHIRSFRGTRELLQQGVQAGNALLGSTRLVPARLGRRTPELEVRHRWRLPEPWELDELWQRVGPGWRRIVVRDAAYLTWRYGSVPIPGYRFLECRDEGTLLGHAVFQESQDQARLVDLVVPAGDPAVLRLLVDAWLAECRGSRSLQATTSLPELQWLLRARGFMGSRNPLWFFVRTGAPDAGAEHDWTLMAGDSDGEFLQAARETRRDRVAPDGTAPTAADLVVRRLDPDTIWHARDAWDDLISRSDADPLFMGWAWQSAWWETWGDSLGLDAHPLGVFDGDRLLGLAPLFVHQRRVLGRMRRELHFAGNAWRISPTVRTEYVDLIADRDHAQAVRAAFLAYLELRRDWDQLIVPDHVTERAVADLAHVPTLPPVLRSMEAGVVVPTTGSFESWLESLGRNTRLKAYNRRRYLEERTTIELEDEGDHERALGQLNALHVGRWGRTCFEGRSLAFHLRMLSRLPPSARVQFSMLELGGEVHSVLYDLVLGGRTYNLQAAFEENYDRKVSLGTLHLGYALERAFAAPDVEAYDLLAGSGKNTQYKRHFKGQEVRFGTYQLIRDPVVRGAFGAFQKLPQTSRSLFRRLAPR
jgi:GNAT superfamily N-acetyltransferase